MKNFGVKIFFRFFCISLVFSGIITGYEYYDYGDSHKNGFLSSIDNLQINNLAQNGGNIFQEFLTFLEKYNKISMNLQ